MTIPFPVLTPARIEQDMTAPYPCGVYGRARSHRHRAARIEHGAFLGLLDLRFDRVLVVGQIWAFALDGALLAVLQGALLSVIAGGRTRLALIAWVGLAIEVTAMLTMANSVGQLIAIAVAGAALTAGVASVTVLRTTPKLA